MIIRHILNSTLYFRGTQWRKTREGDVGENLGVRETKRAAELKTLYKGYLKMYQVNYSKVSCNSLLEKGLERRPKVGVRDHLNKEVVV